MLKIKNYYSKVSQPIKLSNSNNPATTCSSKAYPKAILISNNNQKQSQSSHQISNSNKQLAFTHNNPMIKKLRNHYFSTGTTKERQWRIMLCRSKAIWIMMNPGRSRRPLCRSSWWRIRKRKRVRMRRSGGCSLILISPCPLALQSVLTNSSSTLMAAEPTDSS